MPSHDISPVLRSRLGRKERAVGLFTLGTALLLAGILGYYLYRRALSKGWFLQKVPYYIYVADATGLRVGDTVRMMGFPIGRITDVRPNPPDHWFITNRYNVFIQFQVDEPNFGYIWEDSRVRVRSADILGNREIEVLKGQTGSVTVLERNGQVSEYLDAGSQWTPLTAESKGVWLQVDETPVVTEQVTRLLAALETAVPPLTNQIQSTLRSATEALSSVTALSDSARPVVSNLTRLSGELAQFDGSLGRWLFATNLAGQVEQTLASARESFVTAQETMSGVDSNFVHLVEQLGTSLNHLANITSNLNVQVQSNTNILSEISEAVRHTDELVQGLQKHWFLKSAFKKKK